MVIFLKIMAIFELFLRYRMFYNRDTTPSYFAVVFSK